MVQLYSAQAVSYDVFDLELFQAAQSRVVPHVLAMTPLVHSGELWQAVGAVFLLQHLTFSHAFFHGLMVHASVLAGSSCCTFAFASIADAEQACSNEHDRSGGTAGARPSSAAHPHQLHPPALLLSVSLSSSAIPFFKKKLQGFLNHPNPCCRMLTAKCCLLTVHCRPRCCCTLCCTSAFSVLSVS